MSIEHVVNAWRDEEYRDGLNLGARTILPESPVGEIDLTDVELSEVEGGTSTICVSVIISIAIVSITACSYAIC
jgi:mersacidin/lichenicidin family type 2 lantibiotic